MFNFPTFMNNDTVDTIVEQAHVAARDFVAGQVYTCVDNNGKSKSFSVDTDYICVSNYDQRYLVTNNAKLVEVEKLKSKFIDF